MASFALNLIAKSVSSSEPLKSVALRSTFSNIVVVSFFGAWLRFGSLSRLFLLLELVKSNLLTQVAFEFLDKAVLLKASRMALSKLVDFD